MRWHWWFGTAIMLVAGLGAVWLARSGERDQQQRKHSASREKVPEKPLPDFWEIEVKPERPDGYRGRPGVMKLPLRQDVRKVRIERETCGGGCAFSKYRFRILGDEPVGPAGDVAVLGVDLRPYVPRVPELAKGIDSLTHISLAQQELNRNQTVYRSGGYQYAIANNCLKRGLWELVLRVRESEQSSWATTFHGWFTFPEREYAHLFRTVNEMDFSSVKKFVTGYPVLEGLDVPMEKLRTVSSPRAMGDVDHHAQEAPHRFAEQEKKSALLLNSGVATYSDLWVNDVKVAKFAEPGRYAVDDPERFDLSWLTGGPKVRVLDAKRADLKKQWREYELSFSNGYRIVFGSERLEEVLERNAAPVTDLDVLKIVFGINTPPIYQTERERRQAYLDRREEYLVLLDKKGRLVDNHRAGLDGVYVWKGLGQLHLWLVSYERVVLPAYYSIRTP